MSDVSYGDSESGRPVVVITGATRGIGAAAARAATFAGARVVLCGRSGKVLDLLATELAAAGGDAAIAVADVADEGAAERVVADAMAAFGRIDALVNNAGVIEPVAAIGDLDDAAIARHFAVNVLAPFAFIREALPALRASRGRVVNVSSGAAVDVARGWSVYCAGKAALNQLNAVLAAEEPSLTAVAFSPGMTDTDMQAVIRRDGPGGMHADDVARFTGAFERGELRAPAAVGRAVAALAMLAGPELSGRFVATDDAPVQRLVRRLGRPREPRS